MAVLPEAFGLLVVRGHNNVHVVLLLHQAHDVAHAFVQQVGVVAVGLEDDHGNGQAFVFFGLAPVFDGLDILGVELFQGRKVGVIALLPDAVAQGHQLAHHHGRRVHGAAEKFQHHDPLVLRLFVDDEAGLGNDAVHAFLLHAGQTAQGLVGHVLAQAGQADFVAAQVHHVAHAAADVLDHKDGGFIRQNLVPGMVFALHGDDFARGRDHAPPEQIVQGGSVFEGAGPARVFRDVAADGRGLLGGRVHGKQRARRVHGVDHILGDGPGLAGDGHLFQINGADAGQAGEADDERALARGHGPAGHAGTAAARNERKFHVIGQSDQLGHLLGGIRLHHQQGQFHAQVRGVGGCFHQGRGLGENAFIGQDAAQGVNEPAPELSLRLVGGPEHGDALADGRGVIVGQSHGFPLKALAHAAAHGVGVDEGIIRHQKELLGDGNGQIAHGFGPFREIVDIDLQDAVHHIVGRNGNMRTLMGHDHLPQWL